MSTNNISIKQLLEEYKELSAQEAVGFKLQANPPESLTASKVGGCPYWDLSQPLPTDGEGKTMFLLAQINFEDYPFPAPLPKAGLLQIFIGRDTEHGLDFEEATKQEGFRVVYHKKLDKSISKEQVLDLGYEYSPEDGYDEEGEACFPVFSPRGHSIAFSPKLCYPNSEDGVKHLEAIVSKYSLDAKQEQKLADKIYDLAYDTNATSHLLGIPFFMQSDPRVYGNELSKYDTLLFQLDSDSTEEDEDEWAVMWGDCGVANFFIPRHKLEALDFSDILYNWDCG